MMPGIHRQQELDGIARLDAIQEEALNVLSEKSAGDAAFLYYNSANSGGARPKAMLRSRDGSHWMV